MSVNPDNENGSDTKYETCFKISFKISQACFPVWLSFYRVVSAQPRAVSSLLVSCLHLLDCWPMLPPLTQNFCENYFVLRQCLMWLKLSTG